MEEALTCSCGQQRWWVYSNRLECMSCDREYKLSEIIPIHSANVDMCVWKPEKLVKK